MAKTPAATMELMERVWPKAVARVHEEVADMQKIADDEGASITIEPWDYRFYAEKSAKPNTIWTSTKSSRTCSLEKLREAMMWCATQLYGLQFDQISGVPVFHPDVRVWEVTGRRRRSCRTVVLGSLRPRRQTQRRLDDRLSAQENMNGKPRHADRFE